VTACRDDGANGSKLSFRPLAQARRSWQTCPKSKGRPLTNRVAIWLALLILLALILDYVMGYGATLFLARQFLALIEWVAFWR